jgi:hypothetical protein
MAGKASRIDRCPHCQLPSNYLPKVPVEGSRTRSACPNCAVAWADAQMKASCLEVAGKIAERCLSFGRAAPMMDVAFVFAALIVAGLLRHGVEVYGGIAPADIRWFALVSLAPFVLVVLTLAARRGGQ